MSETDDQTQATKENRYSDFKDNELEGKTISYQQGGKPSTLGNPKSKPLTLGRPSRKSKEAETKVDAISKGLKQEIQDSLDKVSIPPQKECEERKVSEEENLSKQEGEDEFEPQYTISQGSDNINRNSTTPNRFTLKKAYEDFIPGRSNTNSTKSNNTAIVERIKTGPKKQLQVFRDAQIKEFHMGQEKENVEVNLQREIENIPKEEAVVVERPKVKTDTCFLLVNNLDNEDINPQITFNLFKSFGTLLEVNFYRPECHALLTYASSQEALKTRAAMNGRFFCGCKIRIEMLEAEHYALLTMANQYEKYPMHAKFQPPTKANERSKKGLNNPTDTIHISNLRTELVTYENLTLFFARFGTPVKMFIDKKNPEKPMSYVKYNSIEESIMAVAYMNGKDIRGKKLNVAFTRTNISNCLDSA